MDNFIVIPPSPELSELSVKLGFTRLLCIERDFLVLDAQSPSEILHGISKAQGKLILYHPHDEDMLRYVLEKTPLKFVFSPETMFPKDSVHFVRGGLNQILCKIAAEKGKTIVFSFHDLLQATSQGFIIARMMFNIKLCQKYKVRMLLSTFAREKMELRAAHDVLALWRVLGGKGPEELTL